MNLNTKHRRKLQALGNFLMDRIVGFRECFSDNPELFTTFACVLVGLMSKPDQLGAITPTLRALGLDDSFYQRVLDFFRRGRFPHAAIKYGWYSQAAGLGSLCLSDGRRIVVVDGTKKPREGKDTPGLKPLFSSSGSSSKPKKFWGVNSGVVGLLFSMGSGTARFFPLYIWTQEGLSSYFEYMGDEIRASSDTAQSGAFIAEMSPFFGKMVVLADRYYLAQPLFEQFGDRDIALICPVRSNGVAWELPPPREAGKKGAPNKIGEKVWIFKLFETKAAESGETVLTLYSKPTKCRIHSEELLWGEAFYRRMRHVFVEIGKQRFVIASSDLDISPREIVETYCLRFKIETAIGQSCRTVEAGAGRFHAKAWKRVKVFLDRTSQLKELADLTAKEARNGKLGKGDTKRKARLEKLAMPEPLKDGDIESVTNAVFANEGYNLMCAIAQGLLQELADWIHGTGADDLIRWLRTSAKDEPSEDSVRELLSCELQAVLGGNPNPELIKGLLEKAEKRVRKAG